MKKYIKPTMLLENFIANEFISACIDNTSISCLNMNSAKLYKETNGIEGLQTGDSRDKHIAQNTNIDEWS